MTTLEPLVDRTVADRVAERIREAIHDGSYSPGTRLVERSVARELGVSHIPVREALARLADEGLVDRLPRRGARVAELTRQELDEISSLRIVLEQLVARRAQERMTADAELELRAIADRMLQAAADGDVDLLVTLDQRFHERLWELADHELLNELAAQVRAGSSPSCGPQPAPCRRRDCASTPAPTRRWWRRSPTARLPWPSARWHVTSRWPPTGCAPR